MSIHTRCALVARFLCTQSYNPLMSTSINVFVFVQAWTLALLGRCHLVAGEAVTAEGLLRAALDGFETVGREEGSTGSDSRGIGGALVVAGPILFPSPLHPFSKADTLRAFSELLMDWEKRESEGERVLRQAEQVRRVCLLFALVFYFSNSHASEQRHHFSTPPYCLADHSNV